VKLIVCSAVLVLTMPLHGLAQDQPAPLPRVEVTATTPATGNDPTPDLSDFGGESLRNLPLSVEAIDAATLTQRGASSLSQAVALQPAVSDAYNTIGYIESLSVRGFLLNNTLNYRRSGLAASNHAPLAVENVERIELLKGVSGMVAGSSAPGGIVNYVIKRPMAQPLMQVNTELSERGSVLAHLDYNARVLNNTVGLRLNAAAQERKPQPRDAEGNRALLALALDYTPTTRTYVLAQAEWHRVKQVSVPGFGLLDVDGDGTAETVPPPLDPRINLNSQPWTQPFESDARTLTLRAEHAFNDTWRASFKAQLQRIHTDDRLAFPDGCSNGPAYVYPGFCGNYDVDVYDFRSDDERRTSRSSEASLTGKLSAGAWRISPSMGLRTLRYSERAPQFQAYNYVGFTNPFAPQVLQPNDTRAEPNTLRDTAVDEAFANTSIAHGALIGWLGLRSSRIRNASVRTDGSRAVDVQDNATQPWLGASWRTAQDTLLYASFSKGTELEAVPNRSDLFTNAGDALPPMHSKQIELGWRQTFGAGSASVAVFDITRDVPEDVAQNANTSLSTRITGSKRAQHRGVEASLNMQLARTWQLDVALALINARIDQAADASVVGKRTPNVPRASGNLALTWQPQQRWLTTFTNTLRAAGRKPVTADNTVQLPATWQWDMDAQWVLPQWGKNILVRAGIDNVTNRRYWREAPTQSWGGIYLLPAMPRSFRVGVSVGF
jgi:iron complex outermembrane recepter protein